MNLPDSMLPMIDSKRGLTSKHNSPNVSNSPRHYPDIY